MNTITINVPFFLPTWVVVGGGAVMVALAFLAAALAVLALLWGAHVVANKSFERNPRRLARFIAFRALDALRRGKFPPAFERAPQAVRDWLHAEADHMHARHMRRKDAAPAAEPPSSLDQMMQEQGRTPIGTIAWSRTNLEPNGPFRWCAVAPDGTLLDVHPDLPKIPSVFKLNEWAQKAFGRPVAIGGQAQDGTALVYALRVPAPPPDPAPEAQSAVAQREADEFLRGIQQAAVQTADELVLGANTAAAVAELRDAMVAHGERQAAEIEAAGLRPDHAGTVDLHRALAGLPSNIGRVEQKHVDLWKRLKPVATESRLLPGVLLEEQALPEIRDHLLSHGRVRAEAQPGYETHEPIVVWELPDEADADLLDATLRQISVYLHPGWDIWLDPSTAALVQSQAERETADGARGYLAVLTDVSGEVTKIRDVDGIRDYDTIIKVLWVRRPTASEQKAVRAHMVPGAIERDLIHRDTSKDEPAPDPAPLVTADQLPKPTGPFVACLCRYRGVVVRVRDLEDGDPPVWHGTGPCRVVVMAADGIGGSEAKIPVRTLGRDAAIVEALAAQPGIRVELVMHGQDIDSYRCLEDDHA